MNKKIKILLIEDNSSYVRLFHHVLESEPTVSIEFKHVESLQLALESLRQEFFDMIVLDVFLPDGRGIESLKRIQEKDPHVAVVFLTALNDPKLREEALKQGAKAYLLKDQIASEFFPVVEKIFNIRSISTLSQN